MSELVVKLTRGQKPPPGVLDGIGVADGEPYLLCHPDAFRIPDENRPGPHNGTGTSRQASLDVYPRTGTKRWHAAQVIYNHRHKGITRDAIGEVLSTIGNTIQPRVRELLDHGFAYEKGTGKTKNACEAMLVFPSEKLIIAVELERSRSERRLRAVS